MNCEEGKMKSDPSERRKTKNDKRAKARYNKFKRGGHQRATNIKLTTNPQH